MENALHPWTGRLESSPTTRLVRNTHKAPARHEYIEDTRIIVNVPEEFWIHGRVIQAVDDVYRAVWQILKW